MFWPIPTTNRWEWAARWPGIPPKALRPISSQPRAGSAGGLEAESNFRASVQSARCVEGELLAAARELGVREVRFLDYMDGDLDQARPEEVVAKIVAELQRVRPHLVLTFGPEGAYGHPDHIAICQFTTAAILCAADPGYRAAGTQLSSSAAHRVSKLYYMAWTRDKWAAYQAAFRDLKTKVDGVERRVTPWPDWAVTSVIDTHAYWPTVWRAVCCHKSQLDIYRQLEHLPEEHHRAIWGTQEYYRVLSLVNGGRKLERDLFEGLR